MEWFFKLLSSGSVAYSLLLLSFTIVAGLAIGNFKVKGFTLGVTWILFVGIFVGNFYQIDSHILHFVKEVSISRLIIVSIEKPHKTLDRRLKSFILYVNLLNF